ncbi:MAG: phosphate ABC transporter substrate-binding protein [Phycisphaerales bacterium]
MAVGLLGAGLLAAGSAGVDIDPELPVYKPVQGIAGDIKTVGSDTMVNIVGSWAEEFGKAYPAARVQVEGKGSSTAPPALMESQAQFGPMSRAMEPEEVDAFREKFGHEPTALRVAIDCVAVFVNKDCPLEAISLPQLEQVFSVAGESMRWGDLGVEDPAWRDRPVSLYGRNSASGTYKFFKHGALGNKDYKPTVKEQPGSSGVILAVAEDPYAMGYSGIGYATPSVKALRVAFEDGEEAYEPGYEYALNGDYPLARFMYLYVNYDRREGLDPLRAAFVRMVFSRQGQEAVLKDGAFPVTADTAREELTKVGLEPGF